MYSPFETSVGLRTAVRYAEYWVNIPVKIYKIPQQL